MLKIYIKTAWRNMVFHRMSSLINLSGLIIGMAASFLIFMWVKNEYNYDSYHSEASDIYRLTQINKKDAADTDERTPFLFGEQIKKQIPEVRLLARLYPLAVFQPTVKSQQQLFKEKSAAYADANWFKLFHFEFIAGSPEGFNTVPNSVIISASTATKYFGAENPIGKILTISGTDCIVQGIINNYPSNSSFRYDIYISDAVRPVNMRARQNMSPVDSYQTFIKLRRNSSEKVVLNKINSFAKDYWQIGLMPLENIHFESLGHSFLQHGNQKLTNILFLLGILLLSIACINYVNLTTAKASVRVKEVSVKKIVGADRKQLLSQFIVESTLISLTALTVTLILVWISLPLFNRFTDNHFTLSLADPSIWQLLVGTSCCTILLSSIYPAILLSSFKPIALLKGAGSVNTGHGSLRKSLVVIQFAISITLVIATVVIYEQMQFINHQYDNYDKPQLFSFMFRSSLDGDEKVAQMEAVKQMIMSNSSIQNVALTSGSDIINTPNEWSGFDWSGRNDDIKNKIDFILVGSNLNELASLPMKSGRWFTSLKNDRKNFILNETAVRELGIHQPVIGERFSLDQDTGVVIGIVKDFHYVGLHAKIGPLVIGNNTVNANAFMVKSLPGRQNDALAVTKKVWKQFMPDEPFDYKFASDEFEMLYRTDQKMASLIWFFSLLAIFISCLGLYGLATFSAERRIKEIGIRKVLGASVQSIVTMLSSDFVKLVLIAICIAFPIGLWAVTKWLQDFVYHIKIQWWMFALSGAAALLIALITISFQAVKSALTNPVKSLRSE